MASSTVCKLVLSSLASCQSVAHIIKHKPTVHHLAIPKTKATAYLHQERGEEAMLDGIGKS